MIKISTNIAEGRVEIVSDGYVDAPAVQDMLTRISDAFEAVVSAVGFTDIFAIVIGCIPASRDLADNLMTVATSNNPDVRRCAVVTDSAIVSLQVKRIAAKSQKVRVFSTRDEALGWLKDSAKQAR